MAHQMANSTQDCDVPIIEVSPRYPSPLSEIDTQLELIAPSWPLLENTATTCEGTRNDVAHSQERTPESDASDGSGNAISQDALQYTSDEHQIAVNLQQLRAARSSLQGFVPSYTTIQGNISNIRYSVGQSVIPQPLSPHAPAGTYHPLLAAPGETSQYR